MFRGSPGPMLHHWRPPHSSARCSDSPRQSRLFGPRAVRRRSMGGGNACCPPWLSPLKPFWGFGPLLGAATAPEKAAEIIDFRAPPVGRRGAVQCDRRGPQVHSPAHSDVSAPHRCSHAPVPAGNCPPDSPRQGAQPVPRRPEAGHAGGCRGIGGPLSIPTPTSLRPTP